MKPSEIIVKVGDSVKLKPSAFDVLPKLSYKEIKIALGLLTVKNIIQVDDNWLLEFKELPYSGVTADDVEWFDYSLLFSYEQPKKPTRVIKPKQKKKSYGNKVV